MFGSSSAPISEDSVVDSDGRPSSSEAGDADTTRTSGESPRKATAEEAAASERKRRTSSVSRARDIFSSAKNSLHLNSSSSPTTDKHVQSPIQKLSRTDPALGVPQGSHNNSAGESTPTARSTFRVGVTEDKNKKCRRTMEDTHAYLYNFLSTPAPPGANTENAQAGAGGSSTIADNMVETDNGYFAIFDGHAGTFAADWCGKKLHHVLEETIRKNPSTPIPELLDQTFTNVDQQLEKLPLKNSGCTAVIAVLRWEDRVPNPQSATGSTYLNQAQASSKSESAATNAVESQAHSDITSADPNAGATPAKLRESASRQRVLYTANVGDARIVLCRNGRALRLSYDHKGSDENEGRRVANAGGLILNNRVNGVLAVTRALGDAYMKDLVTGHPYTTETVIQPDQDEFIILACDGLWDVCSDQEAVDLIRQNSDPQSASRQLVDYALSRFSTDNLSCMVVRFDNELLRKQKAEAIIGVEGDKRTATSGPSEAQSIVAEAEKKQTGASTAAGGETKSGVVLTGTQVAEAASEQGPPPQGGSGAGPSSGDAGGGASQEFLAAAEKAKEQQEQEPGPELNSEGLRLAQEKASRAQQSG